MRIYKDDDLRRNIRQSHFIFQLRGQVKMFQSLPTAMRISSLFFTIIACCEWLTLTNAEPYGFSASKTEVNPIPGNFVSASSSSFGTGSVSAAAGVSSSSNSFAGFSQDQIDSQLSDLRTGDMININNVRYMALRSEDDPARRDTIILVQIAGQRDESLNGDSYSAAISHLKDVPAFADESTDRIGQSYSAPSTNNNNRENIIGDGAGPSASYSAPYPPAAINRQQHQSSVVASVNGGAGVNDPSSLFSSSSSYSSQELMASNRQSSVGRDHSSSYSYPTSSTSLAGKIRPNQNPNGYEDYSKSIPGVAGQHYPILDKVVATSFSCNGRKEGGYYADVESSCQVYHICALRKKFSFLCPNGTIFDQRVFVCNWWHNVDCASSANYYNLNDLIGIAPPTQRQQAIKNSINFHSYEQGAGAGPAGPTKLVVQSAVSQKPLKQIYGPPPPSQGAVLQPVLIEEAIKRPSSGLKAPLIQAVASSAY